MVMRVGNGKMRAIYHDDYRIHGAVPKRASHVEPIQTGPQAGKWLVDMSPLGSEFQYCLWPPYDTRAEALAAEVEHLVEVWIRG